MRRKEAYLPVPSAFVWQGPGTHGDNILSGMLADDDRETGQAGLDMIEAGTKDRPGICRGKESRMKRQKGEERLLIGQKDEG